MENSPRDFTDATKHIDSYLDGSRSDMLSRLCTFGKPKNRQLKRQLCDYLQQLKSRLQLPNYKQTEEPTNYFNHKSN